MLLKCCIQYASKFGKVSSDHRTGKGQFSFQSQIRAMPKTVQTTTKCTRFTVSKVMLKSFKLPSSSTWTENFQKYKLHLEKTEKPEIKLLTSVRTDRNFSYRKAKEFQKNIYFCFTDYAKAFDCVNHNKLWKILKEMEIPDHLTCLLRNLRADQEATVRTKHRTVD